MFRRMLRQKTLPSNMHRSSAYTARYNSLSTEQLNGGVHGRAQYIRRTSTKKSLFPLVSPTESALVCVERGSSRGFAAGGRASSHSGSFGQGPQRLSRSFCRRRLFKDFGGNPSENCRAHRKDWVESRRLFLTSTCSAPSVRFPSLTGAC